MFAVESVCVHQSSRVYTTPLASHSCLNFLVASEFLLRAAVFYSVLSCSVLPCSFVFIVFFPVDFRCVLLCFVVLHCILPFSAVLCCLKKMF